MKRGTLLTGMITVVLVTSFASANTIIDTFTSAPHTQTVSSTNSDTYVGSGSGIIGGARETYIVHSTGTADVALSIGESISGAGQYSADSLNSGSFSLAYGSLMTGGTDLNADLSGDNYIRILFYTGGEPEQEFDIIATIDSTSGPTQKTFTVAAGSTEVYIEYALFGTPTINTSDIDGIKLYFNNTGLGGQDMTFTIVDSVVPEPATMSLLALGGIAMLKRRKRA